MDSVATASPTRERRASLCHGIIGGKGSVATAEHVLCVANSDFADLSVFSAFLGVTTPFEAL